jgi:GntR family transcriptional regulator
MAALDRHDPTPLYVQMYRELRRRIFAGEYANGTAIPSEPELQQIFNTTRGTVRNAIARLVNDGLVQQVKGKGTFVHFAPLNYSVWNFGSFTDYVRSRNERPVTRVVQQEEVEKDGEPMLRLVRARGIEGEGRPVFLHLDSSLLSLATFPGLTRYDFADDSLYRILREEYDVWPWRSEMAMSTHAPDAVTRELFAIDDSVHCLMRVDGVIYDADEAKVEETSIIYSPHATLRIVASISTPEDAPGLWRGIPGRAEPFERHS